MSTLLNSGNAVLTADPRGLAGRVEAALREQLDLAVGVVVLTAGELAAVVASCPWEERAAAQPQQVHVAYLAGAPDEAAVRALRDVPGNDDVALGPRALYLSYAGRSVDSPLGRALTRADLGTVWTARNWSTATRLVALAG